MKKIFLFCLLTISLNSHGAFTSISLSATVVSFDKDKVVLEIAGSQYSFYREKLGELGKNLSPKQEFIFTATNKQKEKKKKR